jgi:SIT4-associating protein SAP185/190
MGHMLLIADEIEKFFERCPSDLYESIESSFVRSEWNAFVAGELRESRQRDAQPLGGGRPSALAAANAAKQESDSGEEDEDLTGALAGQPLTRSISSGDAFSSAFGFGTVENEDSRFRVVSIGVMITIVA